MSSQSSDHLLPSRAERAFRDAFERLKMGKPIRLNKGALVSQNNVAKEAGCDTSALRKSRYPALVSEIQRWVKEQTSKLPSSSYQSDISKRNKNRSLRSQIQELKIQRDHAISLLVEADAKILDLTLENARLNLLLPPTNVSPLIKR